MLSLRNLIVLVLAALSCGCGGTPGELGNGDFEYVVVRPGDACDFLVPHHEGIAVGSVFGLTFSEYGNATDTFAVTPASPGRASIGPGGTFVLLDPGPQAMVARRLGEAGAVDFVYVYGVEPRFDLVDRNMYRWTKEPSSWYLDSVALVEGFTALEKVVPVGPRDRSVCGAFEYRWSVDDETICRFAPRSMEPDAVVDSVPDTSWAKLLGVAAGTTTLRIRIGDEEKLVKRVTVLEGHYERAP